MRSKKKEITVIIVLVMAIILAGIKITHFVIIERPLKECRIVSAYHLTVDTNGVQIGQSWIFEKDDLTYIDIAKTFEQTYFVTDYAGGSSDSGALNELTIAFGETMDGMPDIRITVSENGYIQINGKRAYHRLSPKKRLRSRALPRNFCRSREYPKSGHWGSSASSGPP